MSSFAEILDILYEDNHCIAINKPNGWPSAHYDGTQETLDRVVKAYLKEKYQKPGNVFLGVVHRLDKPVSGVLLFARTSKGAARFSEQFRENAVDKVYWAIVSGRVPETFGTLEDWLYKDERTEKVQVVPADTPGSKHSVLSYTVLAQTKELSWLEVRPMTGRTHQLRVQLSAHGFPIYGDIKYGSRFRFGTGIGLHARSLSVLHPTQQSPIHLSAEIPKIWRGRFAHLFARRDEL